METTRFQVYKTNYKANKIILVLFATMSFFAIWGFTTILISENQKLLGISISSYVIFLMQSIPGIVLVLKNLKNDKYFFSWDENEIQYHLPNNKEPVFIKIGDIKSVEKVNQVIKITLTNSEIKNFNFTYFYFPNRQKILDFFESLQ
jgi:hypothetical protein